MKFLATACLYLLLLAMPAIADPGLIAFTNTKGGSASTTTVKISGGTLLFGFTTPTNSVAFKVTSPIAEICFDTNISSASTAGSGRVELWRSHNPANLVSVNGFKVVDLPPDLNCYDVGTGTYWLEVSSGTGGASAQVAITGRAN